MHNPTSPLNFLNDEWQQDSSHSFRSGRENEPKGETEREPLNTPDPADMRQSTFQKLPTIQNDGYFEAQRQPTLGPIPEEQGRPTDEWGDSTQVKPAQEQAPATKQAAAEDPNIEYDEWGLEVKKTLKKMITHHSQGFEPGKMSEEEGSDAFHQRTMDDHALMGIVNKNEKNSEFLEASNNALRIFEELTELASNQNPRRSNPGIEQTTNSFEGAGHQKFQYPVGFTADDDLDKDGKIDKLEYQIKVEDLKNGIMNEMDNAVRKEYFTKFRKEVDFHHKIAFRFEKAYRLGKTHPEKLATLNSEIIECISEHSAYVQHDPMALFYCLFFCIYYYNLDIVEFIRKLFPKMAATKATQFALSNVDKLLELIDINGIERLRTVGDKTNMLVYHWVFYQAIDDKLRVVYSKILRRLKEMQFRDKDGRELLITRDYDLIRESFTKFTLKKDMGKIYKFERGTGFSSHSYRRYNAAYFEEVLLSQHVDARVAKNYRERFLIEQESIYQVLQMYSKKDYLEEFRLVDLSQLSTKECLDLFLICWRYDSFKVALHLYLDCLSPTDITKPVLAKFIDGLRDSVKFHEIKLFFILEHFDQFNIQQLNSLVDALRRVFFRADIKQNPMLNSYNTVKLSLLVYRVSWRIQQKKIYSLITKCTILDQYILSSLTNYLETFQNVAQLHKFMHEPILDMATQKDSLDIMLEMNMEEILNHPVVVEVLNLVYEGQYSVDSQSLYLSNTFGAFFQMEAFDLKQVASRLFQNIKNFGSVQGDRRQASLQFNIWKYCLEQRLLDEVFFTTLSCGLLAWATYQVIGILHSFKLLQAFFYGEDAVQNTHLMVKAGPQINNMLCAAVKASPVPSNFETFINKQEILSSIMGLGMFTSVLQKLLMYKLKENCALKLDELLLQMTITITSLFLILRLRDPHRNAVLYDTCAPLVELSDREEYLYKRHMSLIFEESHYGSYSSICGAQMFFVTIYSIILLRRSQRFQYILVMIQKMISELGFFFSSFGAIILVFLVVLRLGNADLQMGEQGLYSTFKDIFDGFNSILRKGRYSEAGQLYMTFFQYLSRVFYMGFLSTIFVLRYVKVSKSIEAERRKDIITLKNIIGYDPDNGAITMSFFPINIVLLPFILPMLLLKSDRLSDTALKLQYALLILLYTCVGALLSLVLVPLFYLKLLLNAGYFAMKNKRSKFFGQNFITFMWTLLFGPVLIIISLIVDLLALNVILMKEEKHFEYKYQSIDPFDGIDKVHVTRSFIKLYLLDYAAKWKGKSMTKGELRNMKTTQFEIVNNFHSFFCRGDKSYTDSMGNIKIFNLTKALGNQCAIPNKKGNRKRDKIEFDVIHNVYADLLTYNFYERILLAERSGEVLTSNEVLLFGNPHIGYDQKRHTTCQQWHRPLANQFDFLVTTAITLSFTEVQEQIRQFQEDTDFFNQQRRLRSVERMYTEWRTSIMDPSILHLESIDQKVMDYQNALDFQNDTKKLVNNDTKKFDEFFAARKSVSTQGGKA